MKVRFWLLLVPALIACAVQGHTSKPLDRKPTESAHIRGPHGLEGWTLSAPIGDGTHDDTEYPYTLVIARNSKIIHRIRGDAFIWSWTFWDNGKQLAYQTGPLHFDATCFLVRVSDWHQIADYDCYHDTPSPQPGWVLALESQR